SADPKLAAKDIDLIDNMRAYVHLVIVIVMSGRPIEITEQLPLADAWIAAWLPGTEGSGVSDMLFGDNEFTGKLPYTWQRWNKQLPFNFKALSNTGCEAPLFAYGYGLKTTDASPSIPECPKP
ncbi:MAG TPA: glycoside hydrolase family 3 C-terminal domain-containing protein, partial [Anaerolineae bacterium]